MSTESGSPPEQPIPAPPMVACRVCETEVPTGAFCGFCGAHLVVQPGTGPDWLRLRAYAAASGEHVLRMSAVSTLFPHLPHRSRAAFRLGLAGLAVVLLVLALLRWQAPLVGVSALGFPVLFQLYLQECDVFDDLPVRLLVVAGVLGAAVGVGWALLTGPIVAQSFAVAIGVGPAITVERLLRDGLAIPLGGGLLMLVPVVFVRLVRPPIRESLDGFLIGSLGAISYIAAATLTRLLPQLSTGVVATNQSVAGLVVEAGIRGVAGPLTAAAAGGIVGAALWVTRRGDGQYRGRPAAVLAAVGVVLAIWAVLGLIDIAPLAPWLLLGLHLVVAAGSILALRIAVHMSLLHEEHDLLQGPPLLCPECHHVVPDMAFCASCGAATRASPRSSRQARRKAPPVPTDAAPQSQ